MSPQADRNSAEPANPAVVEQLARLVAAHNEAWPNTTDPFDPDWRSPCETGEPRLAASGELEIPWQPFARTDTARHTLFAPLERALEITVHQDITTYFGSYYSGGIETDSPEGSVSLLQLWNANDATRLIENLLGHALAKQRAKAPYSVFFACTEVDSELFLAIENHTGHILLERPGYKPERTVAGSLAEFLSTLKPAPPERHPERAAFLAARAPGPGGDNNDDGPNRR